MPFKANDGYSSMPQYNEIILGDGLGVSGGVPSCGILTMTPGPLSTIHTAGVGGADASFNTNPTDTVNVTTNGSTYATCGLKNDTGGSITISNLRISPSFPGGSQLIIELIQSVTTQTITFDPTTVTLSGASTKKRLDGAASITTASQGDSILITLYRGCGPNNGGSTDDYTYITANHYVN
jgi:hypothetical protein